MIKVVLKTSLSNKFKFFWVQLQHHHPLQIVNNPQRSEHINHCLHDKRTLTWLFYLKIVRHNLTKHKKQNITVQLIHSEIKIRKIPLSDQKNCIFPLTSHCYIGQTCICLHPFLTQISDDAPCSGVQGVTHHISFYADRPLQSYLFDIHFPIKSHALLLLVVKIV